MTLTKLPAMIAVEYANSTQSVLSGDRCQHGIHVGVNPVDPEYGRPQTTAGI